MNPRGLHQRRVPPALNIPKGEKPCANCHRRRRVKGERYCFHCRAAVLDEMHRAGYFDELHFGCQGPIGDEPSETPPEDTP